MKLQLGFEAYSYAGKFSFSSPIPASTKKRVAAKLSQVQQAYGGGLTTADVANQIESKYQLVETFYKLEEDKFFIPLLEDDYAEALRIEMSGLQVGAWVSTKTTDKIRNKFRRNLMTRRYDGLIKGVPTRSSARGISHLRRKPGASTGSRPSFVNTGLYMRSFVAWEE